MSIQVENNVAEDLLSQAAHYVPCAIDADGPANVDKFFTPYIEEVDGEMTATFRGHPFNGTQLSFPPGYQAVVMTEAKRPMADDVDRRFQVVGGFKTFTYWNWDKKPSKNDNIVKALDCIDIADAVHGD